MVFLRDLYSHSLENPVFAFHPVFAAELQRELDAANARIQELEAEVARLKA